VSISALSPAWPDSKLCLLLGQDGCGYEFILKSKNVSLPPGWLIMQNLAEVRFNIVSQADSGSLTKPPFDPFESLWKQYFIGYSRDTTLNESTSHG
jgi:hypothetical protein